jgi:hypothetical protein
VRAAIVTRMTLNSLLLLTTLSAAPGMPAQQVAGEHSVSATVPPAGPIARALALLGHEHQSVVLFDPTQYDDAHRVKLEQFEAFVFRERREIYLNRRGRAYGDALAGNPEGVYVLAAILAHELAHLEGMDERGALEAERRYVYRFMKEGRISVDTALAHRDDVWKLRR